MILENKIKEIATSVGFDLVGFSRLVPSQYRQEVEAWIKQGLHGDMHWYPKNIDRRLNPTKHLYNKAMSAITVGLLYRPVEIPPELKNDHSRGLIARYAWFDDYHEIMELMLKQMAEKISQEVQGKWNYHIYVDTGPVLEREVGAKGGLGFVGKNTTLINTTLGSYFFLAEIICDLSMREENIKDTINQGTCGQCQRCQIICPTKAFTAPYKLDARRCISYLTIEHKTAIPENLRPLLKNWIYGCDECQEICPWNKKATKLLTQKLKWKQDLIAPPLIDLLTITTEEFANKFKKSPIKRIKWSRFMRNVLVAAGNWGDKKLIKLLDIHSHSNDEIVSLHARWARRQILS